VKRTSSLSAPFLKQVALVPERIDRDVFPFNRLRFLDADDFALEFPKRITLFVGENGSGKSTLLEAIAALCEFPPEGGSQDHIGQGGTAEPTSRLADAMRPAWLPRVRTGFYFRAESFFNFAGYIDAVGDIEGAYGGRELRAQSHGEAVLALLSNRLGGSGRSILLMDEPEAALSPSRQLALLSLLRDWDLSGNVQVIIATHAPILLSYPGATLYQFDDDKISETTLDQTDHYRVTKAFLSNPDRYLAEIFGDSELDKS